MMFLFTLLSALALGQCEEDPGPQAAFRLGPPAPNERVHIHLEVWADAIGSDWNTAILQELESAAVVGNFVLPVSPDPLTPAELETLEEVVSKGHNLVLRRSSSELTSEEINQLRAKTRQLKKIGHRPRAIVTPLMVRNVEPTLGTMGFFALIQTNAANHALPRYALVPPGRPTIGIVVPKGRYTGPCEHPPAMSPLTPLNLDRVTRGLHASYTDPGVAVIRVVLRESDAQETDAPVLGRWLNGPISEWSPRFSTTEEVRKATLNVLRNESAEVVDPERPTGGRIVPAALLQQAAEEMRDLKKTKASYANDELNASEAYIGFAKQLAAKVVGDGVQLEQISGPTSAASTTLLLPIQLEREAIVQAAIQLISNVPERVPAATRVGATLLTADEFLAAMAAALREDDNLLIGPIAPHDRNAAGLGWGRADID
jgi:hypothetical protein